jgi:hypothetical protein
VGPRSFRLSDFCGSLSLSQPYTRAWWAGTEAFPLQAGLSPEPDLTSGGSMVGFRAAMTDDQWETLYLLSDVFYAVGMSIAIAYGLVVMVSL